MVCKQEIITTNLFKGKNKIRIFLEQRTNLVNEAINFPKGTIEKQLKTVVANFDDGKEVFFLKPGKETLRKTPNIHDMSPNIGKNNISETDKWAFEQIWEYLIKISVIQQEAFKQVLVLLYRLCYYVDHRLNTNDNLRYLPSKEILEFIICLENFVLKNGFREKFKTEEVGLLEFLYFIDLLAWNEDVKYHTTNNKADFSISTKKNVGRVNTVLTIISAPILISKFIKNIIENTKPNGIIDVKLITTTIQKFTKTRGLCIISNAQLLDFLQPYLEE